MRSRDHIVLQHTADIVVSYASNNSVARVEISALIGLVYTMLESVMTEGRLHNRNPKSLTPAIKPKKSIYDDYIICFEDGEKFKSMKRHLARYMILRRNNIG